MDIHGSSAILTILGFWIDETIMKSTSFYYFPYVNQVLLSDIFLFEVKRTCLMERVAVAEQSERNDLQIVGRT